MSVFRRNKILFLLAAIIIIAFIATLGFARNKDGKNVYGPGTFSKPTVPTTYNSTVANLWVKLSNFGFIGDDAFNNPSFEWPGGSGNHYLYQGSFWLAGKDPGGVVHVTTPDEEETTLTTDAADKIYLFGDADADTRFDNRPNVDASFVGSQVSSEDTYAEYTDLDPGRHNPGEAPLGVKIIERTYKWTAAYNDDFIIFDYQFINIGLDSDGDLVADTPQDLTEVYVAIRFDADVSYLGGGEYWYDDLTAYYAPKQISYLYDGDDPDVPGNDVGEFGASPGYIYARLLHAEGGTPFTSHTDPVSHAWWTIDDDPSGDELKYTYMTTPGYAGVPASPYDYRFLQTVGPFDLPSGDTINVVYALGVGDGLDNVILDTDWAKRIFDAGFLAASAPDAPTLESIEKEDGRVTLNWPNSTSEASVDPLTGEADFEGYRVYKSRKLDDAGNQVWVKIADYDKVNAIGANTGLQYQYVDKDVINGYGYYYAITAYDRGAPDEGLGILESSNRDAGASAFVIASGEVRATADEIYVYPNPFVGSAEWDHEFTFNEPFRRKLVFANLPGECTIKIFTLSGDLVDTIENPEGESLAVWDMISRSEQAVVSGIYLYAVESDKGNHIGKFVVIQ